MAALTILSHNEPSELSLQQHLELAPDLAAYTNLTAEGDPEPLMMAQPVPHQPTDKKRVKVYELRNNDWFDRGTGFCTASFATVRSIRAATTALCSLRLRSVADLTSSCTDRRWPERPSGHCRI